MRLALFLLVLLKELLLKLLVLLNLTGFSDRLRLQTGETHKSNLLHI